MTDIKVFYSKESTEPIYINFSQWKKMKDIIDKEFDNNYGSYKEVRIFTYDNELSIEGHCLRDRKREKPIEHCCPTYGRN